MASLAAEKSKVFTIDTSDCAVPSKKPTDTPVKALSKADLQAKLDSADKRRAQKLSSKVCSCRWLQHAINCCFSDDCSPAVQMRWL